MDASRTANLLKAIGPGLLFAGAAIGVSHLVQSTRAGATFGLGLVGVVLLANLTKYPGLSFGSRYSNATGLSLLEGYRRQGTWTLVVFSLLTLGSMFTVVAAVTLVTAAILNELVLSRLVEEPSLQAGVIVLFAVVAGLLRMGGFKWLDQAIKVLLGAMATMTFVATAMVLPEVDWGSLSLGLPAGATEVAAIGFVVALAGWMPAPMDIAVWNSMWALAKRDATGHRASPEETRFDFNLGFGLCVVLALCFVLLGNVVMFQGGVAPASGGVGLAKQILSLFTESLGAWSYPIVGLCAFAVMFSTTLTVLDAFSRVLVVLVDRFRTAEAPGEVARDLASDRGYWIAFAVLVGGALILLYGFLKSLAQMVDLATTLSFVTTPVLALFNHRAMHADEVDAAYRPSRAMTLFSAGCVVLLTGFAIFYLWHRFLRG
jgi:Mn2+/Fe2+ NRAMP family transporter